MSLWIPAVFTFANLALSPRRLVLRPRLAVVAAAGVRALFARGLRRTCWCVVRFTEAQGAWWWICWRRKLSGQNTGRLGGPHLLWAFTEAHGSSSTASYRYQVVFATMSNARPVFEEYHGPEVMSTIGIDSHGLRHCCALPRSATQTLLHCTFASPSNHVACDSKPWLTIISIILN
jgi:hypothetical protein